MDLSTVFFDSVIKYLNVRDLRKVLTVPNSMPTGEPDAYAMYLNTKDVDAADTAKKLGIGCAVLYSSLVHNAWYLKKHLVVTDLLASKNLTFHYVSDTQAQGSDLGNTKSRGWVSFKFRFSSSNQIDTLDTGYTLRKMNETRTDWENWV
jgi:hypothetical protein